MSRFEDWVASLHLGEPDEGGQVGELAPGAMEFLRTVFDAHGPVPLDVLDSFGRDRQRTLADEAVRLVLADLRRTTTLHPNIEVRTVPDGVVVAYHDRADGPALSSLRAPEMTCEVADIVREEVVEELWGVWPACPAHDLALSPEPVDGRAVWYCEKGRHSISVIGELPGSR